MGRDVCETSVLSKGYSHQEIVNHFVGVVSREYTEKVKVPSAPSAQRKVGNAKEPCGRRTVFGQSTMEEKGSMLHVVHFVQTTGVRSRRERKSAR